jgi:hypothetical protein
MGTPVIDVSVTPPILYALGKIFDTTTNAQYIYDRLYAINTYDGTIITYTLIGSSNPNDTGQLGQYFDAALQNQRAGLALWSNGSSESLASYIYISYGSYCDSNYSAAGGTPIDSYNGWVAEVEAGYSAMPPGQNPAFMSSSGSFTTEPSGINLSANNQGGIWMGGAAPAVDLQGHLYLASANANMSTSLPGYGWNGTNEWAHTLIQLNNNTVADSYTPNDEPELNGGTLLDLTVCTNQPCSSSLTLNGDTDLGSGGIVLLSGVQGLGLTNPELIGAGKEGMMYTTWYNPSASSTLMGGLDGCGYANIPMTGDCTVPTDASNPLANTGPPSPTDCTTSASGPAAGSIAQCWEAYSNKNGDNSYGQRGVPAFLGTNDANQDTYLYTVGSHDYLKAFPFIGNSNNVGLFTDILSPIESYPSPHKFRYPGNAPSVSWNSTSGFNTSVVWAMDNINFGMLCTATNHNGQAGYAQLYAYSGDPTYDTAGCGTNELCLLWSDDTGTTGYPPAAVKFTVPTVADGMLMVAGGNNDPPYCPGISITGTGNNPPTTNCVTPTSQSNMPTNCGELVIYDLN